MFKSDLTRRQFIARGLLTMASLALPLPEVVEAVRELPSISVATYPWWKSNITMGTGNLSYEELQKMYIAIEMQKPVPESTF